MAEGTKGYRGKGWAMATDYSFFERSLSETRKYELLTLYYSKLLARPQWRRLR